MSAGRSAGKPLARFQRGFALIAILALAALITAFIIASALNRTPADIVNEREDRSMSALRKAKAALIAYAANEQWQASKGQVSTQPGGLPCPDIDPDTDSSNTGVSAGAICSSNATNRVGRLPFATIGAEDLRDASGERIWYAVSSNFYKSSANVINSETLGQLNVTGPAAASNVVAIVFAPGEALSGQNRLTGYNTPAAYLEGFTPSSPDYTFASITRPSGTSNDRLLVITQAELMATVEPVVAARMERDLKPLLVDYFSAWGHYPFAMTFISPSTAQTAYVGTSSQLRGLLPVTNAALTWQNPTVTQTGNQKGEVVDLWNCSINSSTLTCNVHYTDGTDSNNARPDIRIDVTLPNINTSFIDVPTGFQTTWNLDMLDGNNNVPTWQGIPYGYWSTGPFNSAPAPTQSFSTPAGTLTYTGRLQNANDMHNRAIISIDLPTPQYLQRLTNGSLTWYFSNQWYRETYYAIADGTKWGGGGGCGAGCLTVNKIAGTTNNKRAILIFAGRALDGQARPPAPVTITDYLEGQNATPSDLIFEHRAGGPTSINDRVVIVSP
jgi:hypothetical protein